MNYYIYRDENGEIEAWNQTNEALPPPAEQVTKEFFIEHDFYIPEIPRVKTPSPQEDVETMLVDLEYRMTLLELGVNDDAVQGA